MEIIPQSFSLLPKIFPVLSRSAVREHHALIRAQGGRIFNPEKSSMKIVIGLQQCIRNCTIRLILATYRLRYDLAHVLQGPCKFVTTHLRCGLSFSWWANLGNYSVREGLTHHSGTP